jgi:mycofactocin system glycosyltransferase
VLSVNEAAARLLERSRGGASVADLSAGLGVAEERVFALCERLRSRGILEVGLAPPAAVLAPSVAVIIPTRDRAAELDECLGALGSLDYPPDRLQVVVVDDRSDQPAAVARVARRQGALLLVNEDNKGPAWSRNRAAGAVQAEVLAFVDSDCVPSPGWLRELTPFFAWECVGAVGGRTVAYYDRSSLDRYEEVSSPLDMGIDVRVEGPGAGTFYVPTCNLLVRRASFMDLGGLREDLRTGEDVDLCWRLRAGGQYLVYVPAGLVRHKHRGELGPMLRRRLAYGTSEAALYSLHKDKRKRLPREPLPLATMALLSAAVVCRRSVLAGAALVPFFWDAIGRTRNLRRAGVDLPAGWVWRSVARGHLSMLYFAYFHLVRYYLGPLTLVGTVCRGARRLAALALAYVGAMDYFTKRPRLGYLPFLGYLLAEHTAYQAGAIAGCLREGTFRSYLLTLEGDRWSRGDVSSTGSADRSDGSR